MREEEEEIASTTEKEKTLSWKTTSLECETKDQKVYNP